MVRRNMTLPLGPISVAGGGPPTFTPNSVLKRLSIPSWLCDLELITLYAISFSFAFLH